MPRRAADRPAAYTRTRHLEQFLGLVARSVPARVDAEYVRERVGLRGGDVRACLQSLRVLGLIDAWGRPTARLRSARVEGRRGAQLREALAAAYPELIERWRAEGGLSREEVEGHFRLEFGLGTSSATAAAKLFTDLWRREDVGAPARPILEANSKGGEAESALWEEHDEQGTPAPPSNGGRLLFEPGEPGRTLPQNDRFRTLTDLVHAMIERDWDAERIQLVLEHVEGWLDRLSN